MASSRKVANQITDRCTRQHAFLCLCNTSPFVEQRLAFSVQQRSSLQLQEAKERKKANIFFE